jgi:hypothetical protein
MVAWTGAALVTLARTWDETNIYTKGTVSLREIKAASGCRPGLN